MHMFAALEFERDPMTWGDVPAGVMIWFQVAGGFAFIGTLLWLIFAWPRKRRQDREAIPRWQMLYFVATFTLGVICYVLSAIFGLIVLGRDPGDRLGSIALTGYLTLLTASGVFFVAEVALPFVLNLFSQRTRRIFAIAKLSFKEALRRRVLYVFSFVLLVFMFASWFLLDTKPEDQVRAYVAVVYFVMPLLLLPAAAFVSAFSIPADIKNQTIHTVVTKPVERFEIIVGRFLGFLTLMTLVLIVLTAVSLLYVLRGVHPDAAAESIKAREPQYGLLRFENTERKEKGVSVGREWDYRSYITSPAPNQDAPTACWDFLKVPGHLADRIDPEERSRHLAEFRRIDKDRSRSLDADEVKESDLFRGERFTQMDENKDDRITEDEVLAYLGDRAQVRFEYTFDIYRTNKGEKEGADVTCTVRFYTWRFRRGNEVEFKKERGLIRDAVRDSKLAEKYGYYEITGLPVTDFHTQSFGVPVGLFRNLRAADPERESELKQRGDDRPADLIVRVTCESPTQYVGMARHDLYVRLDDPRGSEMLLFAGNFFKAAFGLWLLLALVIGLCVVVSSSLSGVISTLAVATLLVCGWGAEYIQSLAVGANAEGGPAEAMLRMVRREISGPRLGESQHTTERVVALSDDAVRWVFRRIFFAFPDINRFFLTNYVAEGFNIPWRDGMLVPLLMLVGYLIPWFVLAFYMIRWREIAGAT
jgi:hypothetical protein